MISFKSFYREVDTITEGKYPMWVRGAVGISVLKVRSLEGQIKTEDDPVKQNELISKQNTLLSYITGLGIAVSSTDEKLLQKLRGRKGKGK